ncbi:MAG: hypothetical protein WA254_17100 [Candidatus Sulfotelmatobacter sp.]
MTWRQDTFAYADSYDSAVGRYRGLEAGRRPNVQLNSESVVVKPEIAAEQMEKEAAAHASTPTGMGASGTTAASPAESGIGATGSPATGSGVPQTGAKAPGLRRFHGSATLNATRLSRDVDAIATSVVQHLAGLLDAKVKITLEIEADMPSGAPENVVRTVTENCRTLKFDNQGFEEV